MEEQVQHPLQGDPAPSTVVANEVRIEFTHTIMARVKHIKSKANWWRYWDEVQLVPNKSQSNIWKKLRKSSPSCSPYFWSGNARYLAK